MLRVGSASKHMGLLRIRSTPWQNFFFTKILFALIRFLLLMFGWTKNRYFTFNLWKGNPLGAFKDIKTWAKPFGRTHRIKFSDPINSAWRTYSQSSNYNKQSAKKPLVTFNKSQLSSLIPFFFQIRLILCKVTFSGRKVKSLFKKLR